MPPLMRAVQKPPSHGAARVASELPPLCVVDLERRAVAAILGRDVGAERRAPRVSTVACGAKARLIVAIGPDVHGAAILFGDDVDAVGALPLGAAGHQPVAETAAAES